MKLLQLQHPTLISLAAAAQLRRFLRSLIFSALDFFLCHLQGVDIKDFNVTAARIDIAEQTRVSRICRRGSPLLMSSFQFLSGFVTAENGETKAAADGLERFWLSKPPAMSPSCAASKQNRAAPSIDLMPLM